MKVRLAKEARDFLLTETEYLRHHSTHAAANLLRHVAEMKRHLSQFPMIGPKRADALMPNSRQIIMGDYVVYYQVDQEFVSILSIRHGRMDSAGPAPDEDFDYET